VSTINEKIKSCELKFSDLVKHDQTASFVSYCGGLLNYKTSDGFDFSIPTEDTGSGIFKNEHKATELMRWIRKQVDIVKAN